MKERVVTLTTDIKYNPPYAYHLRVILEYDYSMGFIFKEWYTRRKVLSHRVCSTEQEVEQLIEDEGGIEDYMLKELIQKLKEVAGDVGELLNKYQGATTTIPIGENLLSSIEKITIDYRGDI